MNIKDIIEIIDGDNSHNQMMCLYQLLNYYSKPWYRRLFMKYPYWCSNYDSKVNHRNNAESRH